MSIKRKIGLAIIVLALISLSILTVLIIREEIQTKKVTEMENKKISEFINSEKPEEVKKKYSMEGVLSVPSQGIKEIIYDHENDIYKDLGKGVVLYNKYDKLTDSLDKTSVLLGHNSNKKYRKPFIKLEKVKEGDRFNIQIDGKKLNYVITSRKVVKPEEVDSFPSKVGKNITYLMTCYKFPFNTERLILGGELESIELSESDVELENN